LYKAPFLSRDEIESLQLERVKELVNLSYRKIPFYREKYRAAGFELGDLRTWNDYYCLPIITKDEMIRSFSNRCINSDCNPSGPFFTRSSGSTGKTLEIMVDANAIIIDTLQGIRQFWLQSEGEYSKKHELAHIYTVPWWIDSLRDGEYQTTFISSLIPPQEIGGILGELNPDMLSLYPSNLNSILPYIANEIRSCLFLTVVHSEMSSKKDRNSYSKELGCPVLDEYSSEELTRIALELPCDHYHICEDTVILDVVDPVNFHVLESGSGLAVGTNLLNEAMPFIRYLQGDLISVGEQESCDVKWKQFDKVEGRMNDAFIRYDGEYIPPGTLLDLTYRWMFDTGINIREFEIIQSAPRKIIVNLNEPSLLNDCDGFESSDYLRNLLEHVLGNIELEFNLVDHIEKKSRKYRPIRREFDDKLENTI
jgi:phenylacetate-CoA ligase